jgi:hypothetical protein
VEFIEAPAFTLHLAHYMADEEYGLLPDQLANNPVLGVVMPGTGGFRKLRWADPKRGKGRRGGLRFIYYYFPADQQIWLMTLYGKDEASDLSPSVKKALKSAIENEVHARQAARHARETKSRRGQ